MDIVFYVNRAADQLLAKIDKVPFRRKTVERDLDQVTKRRLSRAFNERRVARTRALRKRVKFEAARSRVECKLFASFV